MKTFPNAFIEPVYDRIEKGEFGAFEIVSKGQPLTKREYFAGLAMQGYASSGAQGFPLTNDVVSRAVEAADALIEKLNETEPKI